MGKLIIEGNSVYEIDEECMREKEEKRQKQIEELKKEKNVYNHSG